MLQGQCPDRGTWRTRTSSGRRWRPGSKIDQRRRRQRALARLTPRVGDHHDFAGQSDHVTEPRHLSVQQAPLRDVVRVYCGSDRAHRRSWSAACAPDRWASPVKPSHLRTWTNRGSAASPSHVSRPTCHRTRHAPLIEVAAVSQPRRRSEFVSERLLCRGVDLFSESRHRRRRGHLQGMALSTKPASDTARCLPNRSERRRGGSCRPVTVSVVLG